MFRPEVKTTPFHGILTLSELIFHATVRRIRKSHGNAIIGLLSSIVQAIVGIAVMMLLFYLLGNNTSPVRGDRMMYIMSGIFSFMTHSRAIRAVSMVLPSPTSSAIRKRRGEAVATRWVKTT